MIDVVCAKCQDVLCPDCVPLHQEHGLSTLSNISAEARSELDGLLRERNEGASPVLDKSIASAEKELARVQTLQQADAAKLRTGLDAIKDALTEAMVMGRWNDHIAALERQLSTLRTRRHSFDQAYSYTRELVKGADAEVVALRGFLAPVLRTCKEEQSLVDPLTLDAKDIDTELKAVLDSIKALAVKLKG